MGKSLLAAFTAGLLVLAGCGDDDSSSSDDTTSEETAAPADESESAAEEESDESEAPAEEESDESEAPAEEESDDTDDEGDGGDDAGDGEDGDDGAAAGTGSGSATLTLANGESYEFSILCALEPQEAAGSEILFTVVSYDEPGLDVTQFGDEGTVTGVAVVSVYDAEYETMWEAGSVYEAFGGTLDLNLEGSTVTASGSFYAGADPASDPVEGELVANC